MWAALSYRQAWKVNLLPDLQVGDSWLTLPTRASIRDYFCSSHCHRKQLSQLPVNSLKIDTEGCYACKPECHEFASMRWAWWSGDRQRKWQGLAFHLIFICFMPPLEESSSRRSNKALDLYEESDRGWDGIDRCTASRSRDTCWWSELWRQLPTSMSFPHSVGTFCCLFSKQAVYCEQEGRATTREKKFSDFPLPRAQLRCFCSTAMAFLTVSWRWVQSRHLSWQ